MVVILHIFIYLCTFSFINHIFIASNTLPPLLSQPEKHLRHPLLLASLPLLQMKMHMPLWNARWGLQGSLKTPLHPGWGTQGFLQHEDTMQMLTDCLRLGFLKLLYFCWFKMGCLSGGWIKTILACSWCVPSFDTYQGCLDIFLAPFAVDIDHYRSIFWTLQQSSTQLDTTRLRHFEKRETGPVPAASKTPRPNPTESWRPKGWPRGTVPKALDSKNPNIKSFRIGFV